MLKYKGTPAAMQQVTSRPAKSPTAPPAISDFSPMTMPCAISAKGTITMANTNMEAQASLPPSSRNARQMKVIAMPLKPTTDHMSDVTLSE